MRAIILIIVLLSLKEHNNPRFNFGDRVVVINGSYSGCSGKVIDYDNSLYKIEGFCHKNNEMWYVDIYEKEENLTIETY